MAIGASTEKFRLTANGIVFHELDYNGLCAAIVGTSRVLLRPGLNTIVHFDHMALWSWCGELILSPMAGFFTKEQHEIQELAESVVRASLVHCRRPTQSKEEWEAQNRIDELQHHHARWFLLKSHLVLAYLAFPFLEALLKRACSRFVDFDGTVKTPFSVPDKIGGQRRYDPSGRLKRCNSLRDLLFLHYSEADRDVVAKVDAFRVH